MRSISLTENGSSRSRPRVLRDFEFVVMYGMLYLFPLFCLYQLRAIEYTFSSPFDGLSLP